MKASPAAIFVTALGLAALPASLEAAPKTEAAPASSFSSDDLPMTPGFVTRLTSYRNCVLMQVDQAPLGDHGAMANEAMSACALSRHEVESQLLSDIEAQHPTVTPVVAIRFAQTGMDMVDPMIEQAAIERAHARYARSMY